MSSDYLHNKKLILEVSIRNYEKYLNSHNSEDKNYNKVIKKLENDKEAYEKLKDTNPELFL